LVVGRRHADTVVQVFTDLYERTGGHVPERITTDGYAVYEAVILDTSGAWRAELGLTAAEEAAFDRQGMPAFYFPVEITYARVLTEAEGNRVVKVTSAVVRGSQEQAAEGLAPSEPSQALNARFVERYHGRQRQSNGRKKRTASTSSEELRFPEACTWLVVGWYNFGWCVRTLREKVPEEPPRYHYRTPAMAAGLTDHVWTMRDLLCDPLYPTKGTRPKSKIRTYKELLERLESVTAIEAPT
jgi:hypothetical protein